MDDDNGLGSPSRRDSWRAEVFTEAAPTQVAPTQMADVADDWPELCDADASLMVPQQAWSQTEPTRYDADYPPTPAAGQPATGQHAEHGFGKLLAAGTAAAVILVGALTVIATQHVQAYYFSSPEPQATPVTVSVTVEAPIEHTTPEQTIEPPPPSTITQTVIAPPVTDTVTSTTTVAAAPSTSAPASTWASAPTSTWATTSAPLTSSSSDSVFLADLNRDGFDVKRLSDPSFVEADGRSVCYRLHGVNRGIVDAGVSLREHVSLPQADVFVGDAQSAYCPPLG